MRLSYLKLYKFIFEICTIDKRTIKTFKEGVLLTSDFLTLNLNVVLKERKLLSFLTEETKHFKNFKTFFTH